MSRIEPSKSSSAAPAIPSSLYGYDVLRFIGQGAGSQIYAVRDPATGNTFALKHVKRINAKDIRFIEQVEREYAVGRQFRHSGLRRSYDLKLTRSFLRRVIEAALVMEYFDGQPLDAKPPTGMTNICDIFLQTARALEALHALGLIHCDLKPNNILLNKSRQIKVIDFGQTCKAGTVKERIQGTPDYIAPEQVKREGVTVRTDVFNLGATLYWALSGQKIPTLYTVKHDANSFLLDQKISTPHEINADVPENLSNLTMECVRTNPSKRPETMSEVASRLEAVRHSLTHQIRPKTPPRAVTFS